MYHEFSSFDWNLALGYWHRNSPLTFQNDFQFDFWHENSNKKCFKTKSNFWKTLRPNRKKANRGQNFSKVWEIVKTAEVAVFDFSEEIWNLALFERRLYVTNDDLMIKTPEQTSNKNFFFKLEIMKMFNCHDF